MLVIHCVGESAEEAVNSILDNSQLFHKIRAKTVTQERLELSIELRLKDASTQFVSQICALEGVYSASLVSYSGEYLS